MDMNIYKRVKADPAAWFSADEVQKAKDYQRPLTFVRVLNSVVGLGVLLIIVSTHLNVKVADRFGGHAWYTRLLAVLGFLLIVDSALDIPFDAWKEFAHERKWEFSTQTTAGFVSDIFKGIVVAFVMFGALMTAMWALIRAT